jgi:uncharacterized protein YgiM (DUF1202 family)
MQKAKPVLVWVLTLLMLTMSLTAQAQADPTVAPLNPNANITWPPPVYVLRGQFTVRGSANLPNMSNYFIEFRELAPDLSVPDEAALWTPATLPSTAAVQDDILGVWNTTTALDGVYELRLTINVRGGTPEYVRVAPIRVENTPSPFATPEAPVVVVPTLPAAVDLPTLQPTPTAFDTAPRVTANRNANVRRGDGTNYDLVGSLNDGDTAPIIGISSFGSGWYYIELPSGARGWVAPSVVTVLGDLRSVPRVDPPPPPATSTPTPQPTPVSSINLVAGNFRFDPGSPKCNETFNVYIDVANFGTQAYFGGGFVGVQDFRRADNAFQLGSSGSLPTINAGQTVNVGPIPLKVPTYYNEEHRLVITIDSTNQVFESNEGDNIKEAIYTLQKASCP